MNIKSKAIGYVGVALISLSLGVAGASAQSADVSVNVGAPGDSVLSASITAGTFSGVQYRSGNGTQNSNGSLIVTATDTRGIGSGWAVTIAANGDFANTANNTRTFALSNLALQSGSLQGRNNASVNGIQPATVQAVSTGNQTIMTASAGNGMGVFDDTIVATIKVPDGTLVGTYKTTMTVSITASN